MVIRLTAKRQPSFCSAFTSCSRTSAGMLPAARTPNAPASATALTRPEVLIQVMAPAIRGYSTPRKSRPRCQYFSCFLAIIGLF